MHNHEPIPTTEHPLIGEGVTPGIVRAGDTVRRPARPFTATIQAYLAHLHRAGFPHAPVPLGHDDQGREMVSFVPGDVPREPLPAEDVLTELARLIRNLHETAASERMPRAEAWLAREGPAIAARVTRA